MDEILDINKIADEYANKFYNKDANPISRESLTQPFIDGFFKALEYADEQSVGFAKWLLFNCCITEDEYTFTYLKDWKVYTTTELLEIYKKQINGL